MAGTSYILQYRPILVKCVRESCRGFGIDSPPVVRPGEDSGVCGLDAAGGDAPALEIQAGVSLTGGGAEETKGLVAVPDRVAASLDYEERVVERPVRLWIVFVSDVHVEHGRLSSCLPA